MRIFFDGYSPAGFGSAEVFRINRFFTVESVRIIDQSVDGKEARVICEVTFTAMKEATEYAPTSLFDDAFAPFVGRAPFTQGQQVSTIHEFLFRKYDSGWILDSYIR